MEVSQEKRFAAAREMQKALRKAFAQMQEAMTAQTVAFNIGDVLPAEQPLASAVEKTQLMPSVPLDAASADQQRSVPQTENGDNIDLDATLAFDPAENLEHAKQSGIKTELHAPTTDTNGKVEEPAVLPPPPLPPLPEAEEVHNSFVTVAAGARSEFAEFQTPAATPVKEEKPAAPKKSPGKAFAVIGGLIAVLVLVLGAVGAGWYYYTNFYAATVVSEPTPSPEPSLAATPIPAATQEAVAVETNSFTESNSNSNSVSAFNANTAAPETPARTDSETPTSRQTGPKPVSSRPTTTAPKATPKPKVPSGRTDTLQ
jgi:hypothetical protein